MQAVKVLTISLLMLCMLSVIMVNSTQTLAEGITDHMLIDEHSIRELLRLEGIPVVFDPEMSLLDMIVNGILYIEGDGWLAYYDLEIKEKIFELANGHGTVFCSGFAACYDKSKTYIIDVTGTLVAEFAGLYIVESMFTRELPFVLSSCNNELFYLFDPISGVLFQLDQNIPFCDIMAFHEGFAKFETLDHQKGFINSKGEIALIGDFTILTEMVYGNSFALKKDGTLFVVDDKGCISSATPSQLAEFADLYAQFP